MEDGMLEYPWSDYACLQEQSDRIKTIKHKAWAVEDQLNAFLDSLAKCSLPAEKTTREKWLINLATNRQKKHRNRSRLLQKWMVTVRPEFSPSELTILKLVQDEQLAQVRTLTTEQEWRILYGLSLDRDYKTIAQSESISVAALKAKVSRCRHRLRERLAA